MKPIVNDKRGQAKTEPQPEPTPDLKTAEALEQTARILGNLEALLEAGLFQGTHAQAVPECLKFVRRIANDTQIKIRSLQVGQ